MNTLISVIVLLAVILQYISERKIESYDNIYLKVGKELKEKIRIIKKEMLIVDIEDEDTISDVKNKISELGVKEYKYLIVKKGYLTISNRKLNLLIANYINIKERACGFNFKTVYEFEKNKGVKISHIRDHLYITALNYVSIFNKKNMLAYGITISKLSDDVYGNIKNNKVISFITNSQMTVCKTEGETKEIIQNIKHYYNRQISSGSMVLIFKILIFVVYSTIITGNLVYSAVNLRAAPFEFVSALLIYLCYIYIIKYIYKPIGKYKALAKYFFPLYFISYLYISIEVFFNRGIDKQDNT